LVVVVDSLVGLVPLANLVFLVWETLLESKEVVFLDFLVFLDDDWETLVEW
jgi:hypothetical protein